MLSLRSNLVCLTIILVSARVVLSATRPNTQIFFGSEEHHARILNVSTAKVTKEFKVADPYARQVTYDLQNKKLYWTGGDFGGIYWADFGGGNIKTFYNVSSVDPDLIAYDWIGKNLYMTGRANDLLVICNASDGSKCASVSVPQTRWAAGWALNPLDGVMFWTTYIDEDKMYRSDMDGSNVVLLRDNVGTSYGLVYDFNGSGRLYWTTRDFETIESSGPYGEDHQIHVFSPGGVGVIYFGITLYYDTLFWSDRLGRTIWSVNKTAIITGTPTKIFTESKEDYVYTIAVLDPSNQPTTRTSPCASRPCSHVCVLKSHSHRCMCPQGMHLAEDDRTCAVGYQTLLKRTS